MVSDEQNNLITLAHVVNIIKYFPSLLMVGQKTIIFVPVKFQTRPIFVSRVRANLSGVLNGKVNGLTCKDKPEKFTWNKHSSLSPPFVGDEKSLNNLTPAGSTLILGFQVLISLTFYVRNFRQ